MMSSLYIASTGMNTHSRGMQVVGNNLSNMNTVGFKYSLAQYQDLSSSTVTAQSNNITGISQLGHGSTLAATRTVFTEGAFESSNTVTDLAISNGNGYFGVLKNGELLYTKAGNMRFDKDGYLLDPTGANLVGRPIINGVTSGSYQAIQVDMSAGSPYVTFPASATGSVNLFTNIGGIQDMSDSSTDPVFGMTTRWDGTSSPPLGTGQYGYSSPVVVYDDQGLAHSMTVYYDYVGQENGVSLYEYVVGINPAEDGSDRAGTAAAGLLMTGTLSFDSTGKLIGMTAFTPTGNDPSDLSNFTQAQLVNGVPSVPVNFAGAGGQQITLNMGLTMTGYPAGVNSPQDAMLNSSAFYGASSGTVRETGATTAYGDYGGSTLYWAQDGYTTGELNNLRIDQNGIIYGLYSNGQSQELYQISLFRFKSQDGLRSEGNNHYSATTDSGPAEEGLPNTENFGKILSQNLEASNVDISREFVYMLINQRGFQANSKIVTTSDTMLQKAMEIKR